MKTLFTKILLLLVFAIILASCETSTAQFKSLNLDSQYDYFNPIWSPTGDTIIFTRKITDTETDIWVVNRNGDLRNIVSDAGASSLSPDGQTIAYTVGQIENTTVQSMDISVMTGEIWLINIDGSNQRNITENVPDSQYAPFWSPNGQYISFVSTSTSIFTTDIWLYDVNNNATRNLTPDIGGAYGSLSWSPDSRYIAVFHPTGVVNEILILDVETGNKRTLVEFAGALDWSPVSNEIVYSLTSFESPIQSDIYVVDASGGTPRNITNTEQVNEFLPKWSPNNRFIAYITTVSDTGLNFAASLWVLDHENNETKNIVEMCYGFISSYSWSPDSEQIAYTCGDNENSDIWVINRDGSNAVNLTGQ